ncbi:MAG: SprT family zinc-dependent metalloprotease [Pseudomonadota bacterium]
MSLPATQREVQINGRAVSYGWVRSRRRRHTHLVMDEQEGLQLRAPLWISAREADALVTRAADWVEDALARRAASASNRLELVDGAVLPCGDRRLELRLRAAHRPRVSLRGNQLVVQGPELAAPVVRASLEVWYRKEAHDLFWMRLLELGQPYGLRPAGLTIRAQKTRWGSCSSRGRISLNWRLLLLPGRLSDYVLAHELCHLRHMNHSRAFWSLLSTVMPDYATREHEMDSVSSGSLAL